jgi:hypothetical protein
MFRKLVTAALLSVALSTSALTQSKEDEAELFFEYSHGPWITGGRYAFEKNNPHCLTTQWFKDGSFFTLTRDLADKEIYITVKNIKWEFTKPKGTADTVHMNVTKKGKFYKGLKVDGALVNKNTIMFRGLPFEILSMVEEGNALDIIMPGDEPNAHIDLEGSGVAVAQLNRCMKAAEKVDLYQNVKPRHPRDTGTDGMRQEL